MLKNTKNLWTGKMIYGIDPRKAVNDVLSLMQDFV